jgi:hypothetical protein
LRREQQIWTRRRRENQIWKKRTGNFACVFRCFCR